MRVTFVVQRYGEEILGGAESLARQIAERLVPYYDVDVLTTCAKDYVTWDNAYPAGRSEVNGISIHRHPTVQLRRGDFGRLSAQLYDRPHTLRQELEWLYAQGPLAPSLFEHIRQVGKDSDVFIFFTYIYYPTALGLRLVGDKALLVPTAHDEPALNFRVFDSLFHSARGILYSTDEERALVQRRFGNDYIPSAIAGLGVDVPDGTDPDRLRAKLGLTGPYFLYLGRIVESKGCDELFLAFQRYSERYPGESSLVLLGKADMAIPRSPHIVYGGYVTDKEKFDAIAGATAVIIPSRYESLSLVALETWAVGRPVVTTAHGQVVTGLSRRSNGGLYYRNGDEFAEILHLILSNPELAKRLGSSGHDHVESTYSWDRVISEYRRMIDSVGSRPLSGRWAAQSNATAP